MKKYDVEDLNEDTFDQKYFSMDILDQEKSILYNDE